MRQCRHPQRQSVCHNRQPPLRWLKRKSAPVPCPSERQRETCKVAQGSRRHARYRKAEGDTQGSARQRETRTAAGDTQSRARQRETRKVAGGIHWNAIPAISRFNHQRRVELVRVLVPATAAAGSLHDARGPPHILGTKLSMTVLDMHDARSPLHEAYCGILPGHA